MGSGEFPGQNLVFSPTFRMKPSIFTNLQNKNKAISVTSRNDCEEGLRFISEKPGVRSEKKKTKDSGLRTEDYRVRSQE